VSHNRKSAVVVSESPAKLVQISASGQSIPNGKLKISCIQIPVGGEPLARAREEKLKL